VALTISPLNPTKTLLRDEGKQITIEQLQEHLNHFGPNA